MVVKISKNGWSYLIRILEWCTRWVLVDAAAYLEAHPVRHIPVLIYG